MVDEGRKVGKRKVQKFKYLQNEKSNLGKVKSIFHNFLSTFFYETKIEETCLKTSYVQTLYYAWPMYTWVISALNSLLIIHGLLRGAREWEWALKSTNRGVTRRGWRVGGGIKFMMGRWREYISWFNLPT